jgi:light-regulated signal transduction histidine kinase (bacteriophytochrome)
MFSRGEKELLGESFGFPIVSGETAELEIVRRGEGTVVELRIGDTEWEGRPARLLALRDITERKRTKEEILRLNAELKARAVELEVANRELEAFNYTVAHDLRKPLTVVNGYCQAIREMCSINLDEPCKGFLREAYDGTLRMNRLIDALLNFARLARVEPERKQVDLSAMAQAAAAELKLAEPERRVSFRIAEGVTVDGDANLLQVVLDNLLGNAWKYTGRQEEALIEFGVTEVDGRQSCFVRDNGVGFAKTEAEKLFLPFQRLPGAEEFRGFGIGLATVERIIRRHGGRVWAEGAPGEGATFYFAL